MKKLLLTALLFISAVLHTLSQSVGINNDGSQPDANAILDVKSSTKGMLMPRLTKDKRKAIANPATGLTVYQTDDTTGYWVYDGSRWALLQDHMGNHTLTQNLQLNNHFISYKGDSIGMKMSDSGKLSIYTKLSCCITDTQERFRFDNNGGLLLRSELGIGKIPMEGKGYRFMWHPYKGAFRAGYANAEWDDVSTGFFSWAGGDATTASGLYSFSFGNQNLATATSSIAFGSGNKVYGPAGFSAGAFNQVDDAYGIAFGNQAYSRNLASMALGYNVVAKGYAGTVVGMYNDSLMTTTEVNYSATTPLFTVGNGSTHTSRSNAMVVRKSGDVEVENLRIGGGTVVSKQQAGTFVVGSNTAGAFKTATFTFPAPFSSIPKIIATPRNEPGTSYPDVFVLTVRSISATQVTFNIIRVDANFSWSQGLLIDYTAWE